MVRLKHGKIILSLEQASRRLPLPTININLRHTILHPNGIIFITKHIMSISIILPQQEYLVWERILDLLAFSFLLFSDKQLRLPKLNKKNRRKKFLHDLLLLPFGQSTLHFWQAIFQFLL